MQFVAKHYKVIGMYLTVFLGVAILSAALLVMVAPTQLGV